MDDHDTSFSPLASTSSALDSRLGRLDLGANNRPAGRPSSFNLQDEDMSFALAGGDDSLDFEQGGAGAADDETVRLAGGGDSATHQQAAVGAGTYGEGKGKAPLRDTDLFFGGSMASASAIPASQRFAPGGLASAASSSAQVHDGEGALGAGEDDDADMDGLEAYTEDERARVASLRSERDGLRSMNGVLDDMKGALAGMEGKMQAFESTISTSHQLLDLYTRIASQAEHTRELLLDREWQGVSRDHARIVEREEAHAAELERQARAEAEAAQRAEEERARAERAAEERRRREEEAVRAPPTRGRGRVLRGAASSSNLRGSSTRGASSSLRGSARPPPSSTSTSSPSASSGIPTRGSAPVSGVRGVRGLRSRVATAGARGGRGRGAAE
ncbi:hypothetical protein JCM9279_003392 [Rhodotorula babjevae]